MCSWRLDTHATYVLTVLCGVQMLEMFEKDDTDMQSSSPDVVPTERYETLRKEYESLQERYAQAQASDGASSLAEDGLVSLCIHSFVHSFFQSVSQSVCRSDVELKSSSECINTSSPP